MVEKKLKLFKKVLLVSIILLVGCTQNEPHPNHEQICKQEHSKSTDWVSSWRTCSGDGAIKKDGTLWQFGKVGGCDWGQIYPIDSNTGKSIYKKRYIYHLKPIKMGNGFTGAKIINGGYRVYGIKTDGSLWGWGENFSEKPMLLNKTNDWVDFKNKWAGNGCCEHNVGLRKDGSIWQFLQVMRDNQLDPTPHFKRVGTQKGWKKVVLHCCNIYATKQDGVLWAKIGTGLHGKFEKIKDDGCGIGDKDMCQEIKAKFRKMPSQSVCNIEAVIEQDVKSSKRSGMLCLMPEIYYE